MTGAAAARTAAKLAGLERLAGERPEYREILSVFREIYGFVAGTSVDGTFRTYMVNGVYNFQAPKDIVPYVLAGVGMADTQVEATGVSASDSSTAYQVGAGSRFFFGKSKKAAFRFDLNHPRRLVGIVPVKKQQFHFLGVAREETEIDAAVNNRGAQGRTLPDIPRNCHDHLIRFSSEGPRQIRGRLIVGAQDANDRRAAFPGCIEHGELAGREVAVPQDRL